MEIEGNAGRLSEEEQRATGYGPEVFVAELRMDALLSDVEMRLLALDNMQPGVDMTSAVAEQYHRKEIIGTMAGQVLAHECEAYLAGHQA